MADNDSNRSPDISGENILNQAMRDGSETSECVNIDEMMENKAKIDSNRSPNFSEEDEIEALTAETAANYARLRKSKSVEKARQAYEAIVNTASVAYEGQLQAIKINIDERLKKIDQELKEHST